MYFHFNQQNEGMAMGNSLYLVISNIFMEHFKEIALDTADHKLVKWFRYIVDTVMVWPHGPARLQQFLHHPNSIRLTIKFTMEVEANDTLPFFNFLVLKRGTELFTKMYCKPTHAGCYLHLKSNYPHM
jgi:hypothetical protein